MKDHPHKEFKPMHPGEFIKVTYSDISIRQLSETLNLDIKKAKHLLAGKEDVTPELAVLLSESIGRSRESWLVMQAQYNEYHSKVN